MIRARIRAQGRPAGRRREKVTVSSLETGIVLLGRLIAYSGVLSFCVRLQYLGMTGKASRQRRFSPAAINALAVVA